MRPVDICAPRTLPVDRSIRNATLVRQVVTPDVLALLRDLRGKVNIGMVGGSDLAKQKEQLGEHGVSSRKRLGGVLELTALWGRIPLR